MGEAWGCEIPPYHNWSRAQNSEGFGHIGSKRSNSWREAWEKEHLAPPNGMLFGRCPSQGACHVARDMLYLPSRLPLLTQYNSSARDLINGTRLVHIAQNNIHWHSVLKQISLEVSGNRSSQQQTWHVSVTALLLGLLVFG